MFTPLGIPFESVPGHHALHVLRRRQQCVPRTAPLDVFPPTARWPHAQSSILRTTGIAPRAQFAFYAEQFCGEYFTNTFYRQSGRLLWNTYNVLASRLADGPPSDDSEQAEIDHWSQRLGVTLDPEDPVDMMKLRLAKDAAEGLPDRQSTAGKVLHYSTLAFSSACAAVISQPFALAAAWQTAAEPTTYDGENQILDALGLSYIQGTFSDVALQKSIFSGLGANVAYRLVHTVASDYVSNVLCEWAGLKLDREPLRAQGYDEEFKASLRQHFRYNFKRCFFRYIANLLVGTVTYPLLTVRERLHSQGASYRIPMRYDGFLDCVSQIFAQEGWAGFYQGYLAFAALTLPDLLMVTGQYLVTMFSIEYGPVNTYRNLTKLINGPL